MKFDFTEYSFVEIITTANVRIMNTLQLKNIARVIVRSARTITCETRWEEINVDNCSLKILFDTRQVVWGECGVYVSKKKETGRARCYDVSFGQRCHAVVGCVFMTQCAPLHAAVAFTEFFLLPIFYYYQFNEVFPEINNILISTFLILGILSSYL